MKQRKAQKIKRYRRSFNGQAERSLVIRKIVIFAIFLLVLFAVGWLLAKPGIDLGTKLWYSIKNSGNTSPSSSITSSVPNSVSTAPESIAPESTPAAAPVANSNGNWAYVSLSSVDTPERAAQTAKSLAAEGIKAAVLTLKDERGFIYYPSSVYGAAANISTSTIDAAAIVKAIEENGVIPVAAISAFKDANAPQQNRDMAVTYMGQDGFLWLNNKAELGGVPWLNPYSKEANTYINDIIAEVLGFGFKEVILQGVQFPSGFGLDLAGYRQGEDKRSKENVLTDCVAAWQTLCEDKGAVCWFEYSATGAIKDGDATTVISPLKLGAKNVLLDFAEDVVSKDGVDTLDTALLDAAFAKAQQNGTNAVAMRVSNGKLTGEALQAATSYAHGAGYVSAVVK
ncbi:MAG: putative glycoside hydrolase [Oscillospiraceae bacterium]